MEVELLPLDHNHPGDLRGRREGPEEEGRRPGGANSSDHSFRLCVCVCVCVCPTPPGKQVRNDAGLIYRVDADDELRKEEGCHQNLDGRVDGSLPLRVKGAAVTNGISAMLFKQGEGPDERHWQPGPLFV